MRRPSILLPRLKPLPARRSYILSALDVGTSKVVCLIARLDPMDATATLAGRTHKMRVLGIGHQRSRGIKAGAVVDLDAAEKAIRLAVDSAERMAGVEVERVIVNLSGGRIGSQHFTGRLTLNRRAVSDTDVHRVIEAASAHAVPPGRSILHALPVGYALDSAANVQDPRGMVGEHLSVDLHIASADMLVAHNQLLAVERAHIGVEAQVATPYASALSVMVDDEAEMGGVVVDIGGGTTTVAVFAHGHLVHVDAIAVGGNHVTMDIARGLSMALEDAERLKNFSAACIESSTDERDVIAIRQVGDEERDVPTHVPRAQLVRIVRPRMEEVLELARDRLKRAGFGLGSGRRLVLTGGGAQIGGLVELARRSFSAQARIGRPVGVQGLPEAAKNPAFAACVGLLVYPQVAGREHFETGHGRSTRGTGTDGYISRVGRWLKDSF